ncbi:ATP-dependent helicase HrpA [Vitiosangium sp. GDMCC 1.1324]|nr:ATP-dependent helicase HrpA [Vitiosangium sp. GDMCC 1.1324]
MTAPNGGRAIVEHLELPALPGRLAPARGPPQSEWC